MTIKALYRRVTTIDTDLISEQSIDETIDEIRRFNLLQLLDGKTNTGADITPSYFQDPFFKTPLAAMKYSKWKDEISPPSNRKTGTPNFYINGFYHGTIQVRRQGDVIVTGSNTPIGKSIEARQPKLYGLSPASRKEYIPLVLMPRFKMKMKQAIGIKF